MALQLDVITPERRLLSEQADSVTVPGRGGELGILPGHTPLISELQTGVLSYAQGATTRRLLVSGGFVEVNDDRVSVLADMAEFPQEVDAARARAERDEAEKRLGAFTGAPEELAEVQAQFDRASARLQLAAGDAARGSNNEQASRQGREVPAKDAKIWNLLCVLRTFAVKFPRCTLETFARTWHNSDLNVSRSVELARGFVHVTGNAGERRKRRRDAARDFG